MQVVVFTESKTVENEHIIIHDLFKAGLKTLHLRKPGTTRKDLKNYLTKIPAKYYDRIVLHNCYSMVFGKNFKGIHLSEHDRRSWLNRLLYVFLMRIFRPGVTISTSLHRLSDIEKRHNGYNYAFFSPVFESISKPGHAPKYGMRDLERKLLNKKIDKIYALGGVDENNIDLCFDAGFNGVGLLGAIWKSPDPVALFKNINEEWAKKKMLF